MRQQLRQAAKLREFPFTWTYELTVGVDRGWATLCGFMTRLGLHDLPVWRSECTCNQGSALVVSPTSSPVSKSIGALEFDLGFVHSRQSAVPQVHDNIDSLGCGTPTMHSWTDYYRWRRLPLEHPAAIVLSTVLTLYYATRWCLTHLECDSLPEELDIHFLGARQEVHQSELMEELMHLMPGCCFHIHLIGPHVPLQLPPHHLGKALPGGSVSFHSGLYHEILPNLKRLPDLIFAPNAGISAYSSWIETLNILPEDAPLFVTDFCEEAAIQAACVAKHVSGRRLAMQVGVNAFRKPASCCAGNSLPSYGNGFMFALV